MEPEFAKTLTVPDDVESMVFISDIHGVMESLTELEPIISRLEAEGPVQVMVLGDIIAGGVNPIEVLEWVMSRAGPYAVLGNHDIKVLNSPDEPAHLCTEQGVRHLLSNHQRKYLEKLSLILELNWHNHVIKTMHGHVSPANESLSILELPDQLFDKISSPGTALAVSGHTHFPFIYKKDGRIVANCGSTGRQMFGVSSKGGPVISLATGELYEEEKQPFSSCLVVKDIDGTLDVQLETYEYDRQAVVEKLRKAGDPWFEINKIIFETGVAYW